MAQTTTQAYPEGRMLFVLKVPVHCSVLTCSTRAVSFSSVSHKGTEASEISWMPAMKIKLGLKASSPRSISCVNVTETSVKHLDKTL